MTSSQCKHTQYLNQVDQDVEVSDSQVPCQQLLTLHLDAEIGKCPIRNHTEYALMLAECMQSHTSVL